LGWVGLGWVVGVKSFFFIFAFLFQIFENLYRPKMGVKIKGVKLKG